MSKKIHVFSMCPDFDGYSKEPGTVNCIWCASQMSTSVWSDEKAKEKYRNIVKRLEYREEFEDLVLEETT